MPRHNLLTPAERTGLLAFPATDDELIQHYTFAEPDLSVIRQRRGSHSRCLQIRQSEGPLDAAGEADAKEGTICW